MKRISFLALLYIPFNSFSQSGGMSEELFSPKPGIYINGNQCLIGNTIYSCTPKTCDSIVINSGDSIEFCTGQQIFLNTDTAYYMDWHFNGSDNYQSIIHNGYPNSNSICYYPKWTNAGDYIVHIYYNGWLSAYPTSDCYSFGASHWIIKVTVLQSISEVEESLVDVQPYIIYPNPSNNQISINGKFQGKTKFQVCDMLGQVVFEKFIDPGERTEQMFLNLAAGAYSYRIETGGAELKTGKLVFIE